MDDDRDDIKNIIDDMVDFSDSTDSVSAEETKVIPVRDILKKSGTAQSTAASDDAGAVPPDEANDSGSSAPPDTADDPDAEPEDGYTEPPEGYYPSYDEYDEPYEAADFDYDFEHDDYDEDDTELVTPMIKPILKRLIPLLVILLILTWGMTTSNPFVKNYRKNFTANLTLLAENLGLKKADSDTDPGEFYAEGLIEYKQASEKETATDSARGAQYRTDVESDKMITFEGASGAQFAAYRKGAICASTNYVCYINRNGDIEWEKNIAITDPILRSEGDYFLVAQKNGTRFTLYKGEKAVYDMTADNNILTGNVSSGGDVVLVTDKAGYKGAVVVYNKRGDNAFSWSSGSAQIMSADIAAGSRRVAAALLNTESSARSYVYMFNLNRPDSYARQEFQSSLIYKVDFKGNRLNVFADNMLAGMKLSGSVAYKIEYGDSEATRASLAENGDKLVLFTGTNIPMLNIYNKNGRLKKTISSQKVPGFAYIHGDDIVYNVDREVLLGKTDAEIPYKYTAIMDIKGIVPIDGRSFLVIYSNSISMVRMRGAL